MGFDNTALCELIEPALTTINVPRQALSGIAVERLVSIISGVVEEKIKIEVPTSLVKRKSL